MKVDRGERGSRAQTNDLAATLRDFGGEADSARWLRAQAPSAYSSWQKKLRHHRATAGNDASACGAVANASGTDSNSVVLGIFSNATGNYAANLVIGAQANASGDGSTDGALLAGNIAIGLGPNSSGNSSFKSAMSYLANVTGDNGNNLAIDTSRTPTAPMPPTSRLARAPTPAALPAPHSQESRSSFK